VVEHPESADPLHQGNLGMVKRSSVGGMPRGYRDLGGDDFVERVSRQADPVSTKEKRSMAQLMDLFIAGIDAGGIAAYRKGWGKSGWKDLPDKIMAKR
jgi:hypothetical protein